MGNSSVTEELPRGSPVHFFVAVLKGCPGSGNNIDNYIFFVLNVHIHCDQRALHRWKEDKHFVMTYLVPCFKSSVQQSEW